MKILTYSPKLEVYAAVSGNGGVSYYDLSGDVTSCTVNRKLDAPSEFTVHLANRNHKYNDIFTPMDRLKVAVTKNDQRNVLISGYISSVPKFTLYTEDAVLKGYDSLYRLQQLYFDPGLLASEVAQGMGQSGWSFGDELQSLLVNVAGINSGDLMIGEIPNGVVDWARNMYAAQQSDIADAETMIKDFYTLLKASTVAQAAYATSSTTAGGVTVTAGSGNLSASQRTTIVNTALSQLGVPYVWGGESLGSGMDCSGLVVCCYRQAGVELPHQSQSIYACIKSPTTDWSSLSPGDVIVWGPGEGGAGASGHIAIYIGDNEICEEVGGGCRRHSIWGGPKGGGCPA
jgi:cell wall-associated NlpC family hydrolase